ncbi:MAG: TonB family protein [Deltaproteobacteria bacterium]|nr:TonB family protein [Deltaproteobacteria bacterium]
MAVPTNKESSRGPNDIRWRPMVVVSILFHLAVFCTLLFVPESLPTPRFSEGVVYEVDLVELPARAGAPKAKKGADVRVKKGSSRAKKVVKARRIPSARKKEKPLIIAKRTIDKPVSKTKKPEVSPSRLIDKAISKIRTEVKKEEHVTKAISRLESKVGEKPGPAARRRGFPVGSAAMQIYQMEVETWIKSHWAYPVAIDTAKEPEAVVLVTVKRDGTIIRTEFEKHSSSAIFDQSVLKAIERSNPLPPFPEGYGKEIDEIQIKFDLKDLESS